MSSSVTFLLLWATPAGLTVGTSSMGKEPKRSRISATQGWLNGCGTVWRHSNPRRWISRNRPFLKTKYRLACRRNLFRSEHCGSHSGTTLGREERCAEGAGRGLSELKERVFCGLSASSADQRRESQRRVSDGRRSERRKWWSLHVRASQTGITCESGKTGFSGPEEKASGIDADLPPEPISRAIIGAQRPLRRRCRMEPPPLNLASPIIGLSAPSAGIACGASPLTLASLGSGHENATSHIRTGTA